MSATPLQSGSVAAASDARLWGTWTIVEQVDDEVVVDALEVRRAGVTAQDARGRTAVGSAAGFDDAVRTRAFFELCERIAVLDAVEAPARAAVVRDLGGGVVGMSPLGSVFSRSPAPDVWQPALSSGVALGRDFASACEHAALELLERDRVLRSWASLGPSPQWIPLPDGPWSHLDAYEWQAYRLPAGPSDEGDVAVACVFGFPTRPGAPLLRGFAAARGLARARDRAMGECLQNLAFLWGEPLPSDAPAPSPTPLYHLDHYLWPGSHGALRRWLHGHAGEDRLSARPGAAASTIRFVDLTPPDMPAGLRVVRALADTAVPLCFGAAPRSVVPPSARGPHPIS